VPFGKVVRGNFAANVSLRLNIHTLFNGRINLAAVMLVSTGGAVLGLEADMRRREFIAFLGSMGVAATSGAFAQTPKIYRIGTLSVAPPIQ
jgi:hypothetical protein